ncbi:MAG: glycosyltransferase [Syntrophobacteraceae bacterium]
MKIDLHVHSKYSVRPSQWILQKLGCPECFTEPSEVYRIAGEKGMDLVTITDHNTISGSAEIAHLPGTFISEEVTTYFPHDGCKAHVLVYCIDEMIHREIQKVRENIFDLVEYLGKMNIVCVLAHPLFAVNDKLSLDHFEKFLLLFKHFELNGVRDNYQNRVIATVLGGLTPARIEKLIDKHGIVPVFPEPWRKSLTGGSDDHSSLNIARQYTQVLNANSRDEFFLGLENHESEVIGRGSTPRVMAHNLYGIAYQYYKRKLGLENKVNKDIVLRFLDRCLQTEKETEQKLVSRIICSLRHRKTPKKEDGSRIEDLLRFEAQRLLQDDPSLMEIGRSSGGEIENSAERWFDFINQVSNKVLLHFWNSLLSQFSGANFFNIFQSLGSAGALYTVLAPYFLTFTLFSRDRVFSKSVLDRFTLDHIGEKPVKIAHFTDTFYEINGVALTLHHQLELARQSGKALTVITCDSESRPDIEGVCNFEPIGFHGLPEYPEQKIFLPPFLEMLNYCYENEFTRIHVATPGPLGLAALAIGRIMKIPVSGTYHTAIPQYALSLTGDGGIEDLVWKYTTWFYDQLSVILVPSVSTGNELIGKGIDSGKIRLFPRGVDTERFHPAKRDLRFIQDRFGAGAGSKILYVGRISKEKDLHLLAQAFQTLTRKFADVELIFVGDGAYLDDLKQSLSGMPCIFTGYREGEELAAIYASCDLFAFPSATDTFGNVVLEAQASGLPVVVTNSGGPQENLIPNRTGLIFEAGDADSLTQALEFLLSDHVRRNEMGKAARKYMDSRSHARAFDETWRIYQGDDMGRFDTKPPEVAKKEGRRAA